MNKQQLIEKFEADKISKAQLGQLRRIVLEELLGKIKEMDYHEATEWLDTKRTKLLRPKLAEEVGYKTVVDTLRQTLKPIIMAAESYLKDNGIITGEAKSNTEIKDDNETGVIDFLNKRLGDKIYEWPTNNRNKVYHRVLWAFYIDTPVAEVNAAPTFFSRNKVVRDKMADIDVLIAQGKVKTLNYEKLSALDDMENNMTSAAISKLSQQLNQTKAKLAITEEKLKKCEIDNKYLILDNEALQRSKEYFERKEAALLGDNVLEDVKLSGAYP
jgi:hypothetical protein